MNAQFNRGFTLMELMIVVVIIGILAGVALPSYQEALRKGKRADAKSALQDAANRQERFMLDRSTYTSDPNDIGMPTPFRSEEGYYQISMAACPTGSLGTCYTLTATPVPGGAQDDDGRCGNFILNSDGSKSVTGTSGDDYCW
ncbi:type IV pilin protein [Mangrovimicrobium sediminis]|uniref:Type IV pilin protein n=1 Tax=Mangrovimicrobium sediminis TaxID=2562682 RepID=A0A4Z0M432_9GAMM|nr:type IV pilin protein [Haliea sp. SAOS-164]TGD74200.1 type IV pilin protein [Haliea sp. SAOS-164]